jgi:hypothetical protein
LEAQSVMQSVAQSAPQSVAEWVQSVAQSAPQSVAEWVLQGLCWVSRQVLQGLLQGPLQGLMQGLMVQTEERDSSYIPQEHQNFRRTRRPYSTQSFRRTMD